MNNLNYRFVFVSILVACVFPVSIRGAANLTPQQLILLMKASSEQYISVCSNIKGTVYQQQDSNAPKAITVSEQILSRWTKGKKFSKSTRPMFLGIPDVNNTQTVVETYVITPQLTKSLREQLPSRTLRGSIKLREKFEQDTTPPSLYDYMWGLGGFQWENMDLDASTVTTDKQSGYYILKAKMGGPKGPFLVLYADSSKDYIPVKQELLKYDDIVMIITKCSDFYRLPNGLWVPRKYSWHDPRFNLFGNYTFEDIVVNEPIKDNLLDFEFPEGTIVNDERIGSQYRAGKTAGSTKAPQAQQKTAETKQAASMTGLAGDEQLQSTADKARELMAKEKTSGSTLTAVEVFPQIIFVKPDKDEYTISVKSNDGKKRLVSASSLTSNDLVLTLLKDLAAQEGKLVVSVKRKQGSTGFAQGILHTEFNDAKIDVTIVSPPVGDN